MPQPGAIAAVSGLLYPAVRGGVQRDARPTPPRLHAPSCISDLVVRCDGCLGALRCVIGAERGSDRAGLMGSSAAVLLVAVCAGVESLRLLKPRGRRPSAGHSRAAGASGRGWLIWAVSGAVVRSVAAP